MNHRIVARLRFLRELDAHASMLELRIGERVTFHPDGRPPVIGVITRYNKKTVSLLTEDGQRWNVAPQLVGGAVGMVHREMKFARMSAAIAGLLVLTLLAAAVVTPASADADADAKQDMKDAGQNIKDAAHSVGSAVKKAAHKIGDGVKKGTHAVAKKVHASTQKVEDKTASH